jgi:hypothetical protein
MKFVFSASLLIFGACEIVAFMPLSHPNWVGRDTSVQMSAGATTAETYTVNPIKSLDGTVTLPGSKSLSNRCLLLAALSDGKTKVDNLLESDDIRYMLEALDQMQVPVERHSAESVTVTGQSGPINSPNADEVCELFLGNAGTAMRPLAAALCMGKGKFVLDGVPRMRERPIADLIDGLQQLGADVTCVEETGCPPVTINANGLSGGKVCTTCQTGAFVHRPLSDAGKSWEGIYQWQNVLAVFVFSLNGGAGCGWGCNNRNQR